MDADVRQTLQSCRPDIRARWEELLRDEPCVSPLGNPDLLARLFDSTLDEIFRRLRRQNHRPPTSAPSWVEQRAGCACGRNPFLAYFETAERALGESLFLLEAMGSERHAAAAAELRATVRRVARREVKGFCSLCQLPRDDVARVS